MADLGHGDGSVRRRLGDQDYQAGVVPVEQLDDPRLRNCPPRSGEAERKAGGLDRRAWGAWRRRGFPPRQQGKSAAGEPLDLDDTEANDVAQGKPGVGGHGLAERHEER